MESIASNLLPAEDKGELDSGVREGEYWEVEVNRWFSLRTGTRSRTISILDRFNAEREQTTMKNASIIGNCVVIGMSTSIIRHRFRDFDLSSISSSNLIFRVSSVKAKTKVCLSLSLSLSLFQLFILKMDKTREKTSLQALRIENCGSIS